MLVTILNKIYKKINIDAVHRMNNEKMTYDKQMEYLSKFSSPQDDFERSYYKYKCFCKYCYYKKDWMLYFYNIGAMFLLPFLHIKLKNGSRIEASENKVDIVIENVPRLPNNDILPDELLRDYKEVKEIISIRYSNSHLNYQAEEIYRELRKNYFFHFYFRIIVMLKLAQFSSYIEKYHPNAIAFYSCEREFSGPLQTLLCEKCNVKYISFMHGDYLSRLSFAFQRYSLYYIWDISYDDMFKTLKCSFPVRLYTPQKLQGLEKEISPWDCCYFATYYFSDETREEVIKIYDIFSKFEAAGLRTKIRPHPRFSDVNMLKTVFVDIEIENTSEYSLNESISQSLYIVGLNTTVLSQAYFSKKIVVIDDVSAKEKYRELNKRGYVMIKRKHVLLSELSKNTFESYDDRYLFFKK
ncbi:MAG: hypothetical protein HFJ10_15305 [Lachnospiraceae bacterium]|nr:hypothetical protein [Lachnospiraceae bacterium]